MALENRTNSSTYETKLSQKQTPFDSVTLFVNWDKKHVLHAIILFAMRRTVTCLYERVSGRGGLFMLVERQNAVWEVLSKFGGR